MKPFLITEVSSSNCNLNKQFSIVNDTVVKKPSANLAVGAARVLQLQDFNQFDAYLAQLAPNQAIILGVPKDNLHVAKIVKKGEEDIALGVISRSNYCLTYPVETGLIVIDYDPDGVPSHLQVHSKEELVQRINLLIPETVNRETYGRKGSSSGIHNAQGECVSCKESWHAYIRVDNATPESIANLVHYIHENAVKHNLYFLKIHKNGSTQLQTIIDESVIKSANSRLVYEAAPTLLNGLTRDTNQGLIFNSGMIEPLDLGKISAMTSVYLWETAAKAEKIKQAKLIEETKKGYLRTKKLKLISEGHSEQEATAIVTRFAQTGLISVQEFITLESGEKIKIIDAMFQVKNHSYIADPYEPEKGNGRAVLNVKEYFNANIYSYLDGGQQYQFSYIRKDIVEILGRINTKKEHGTILKALKKVCVDAEFKLDDLNLINDKLISIGIVSGTGSTFKASVLHSILQKLSLEAMKSYALLKSKGKVGFIDIGAIELESYSLADLKLYFKNKEIFAIDPETEKVKAFCPLEIWLKSRQREEYIGIDFIPDQPKEKDDKIYGLFRGFKYPPAYTLDISLFLTFVWEVICSKDDLYYNIIITFFAQIMQEPSKKYNVALVLISGKGSGKSTLMKAMSIAFDGYYMQTADTDKIVGKFNNHIATKLLCYANESFFIGDKRVIGKLKNFISEKVMTYEIKGGAVYTGKNVSRLVIDSNDENVVHETADERRFLYALISLLRVGDSAYFEELYALIEDPRFGESLTYYLMTFDIKPYVHYLKFPPRNEVTIDQQLQNLDDIESWWLLCLQEGEIMDANYSVKTNGDLLISNRDLYDSFVQYTKKKGKRIFHTQENFGRALNKKIFNEKCIVSAKAKTKEQKNAKVIASLDVCQRYFVEKQKLVSYEFAQTEWTAPELHPFQRGL
jgi:hypothetical protein